MAERKAAPAKTEKERVQFVSSGSKLLDLALSGGWAQGRISNIVGDRSAGKTLIAIEACANFGMVSGSRFVRYAECEAAFDQQYAQKIGMPDDVLLARNSDGSAFATVEDFYRDIDGFLDTLDGKKPALYVLDSLDALSDEAELKADFGAGSFGTGKAKDMSKVFRLITSKAEQANCHLMIISQLRDKIGVMFGEKQTRSGGRALNFYASQIVWLAEVEKIKKKALEVERVIGVRTRARVRKLKVGPAHREVELAVLFNYGIDDEESIIEWLKDNKGEHLIEEHGGSIKMRAALNKARQARDRIAVKEMTRILIEAADTHWRAIEDAIQPTYSKYGDA